MLPFALAKGVTRPSASHLGAVCAFARLFGLDEPILVPLLNFQVVRNEFRWIVLEAS
jgi:hypothetical protein